MSRSLSYLTDAIRGELGDASGLFTDSVLERFVAEGQRKLEPEHLLDKTATVAWADAAASAALPADLYEITTIIPDSTAYQMPWRYRQHGLTLYFDPRDTIYAFSGKLFYRAHYPDVTATIPCALPDAAADALISYGLYKSFHRIAANRAEYRRYVTLTQNGVTVGDLLSAANTHLADYNDAKTATQRTARPVFYDDED